MPAKSDEGPPFPVFVAEGSSNHHRDLKRCFDFVRSAEEVGCGAVTLQLLRIRELFAVEAPRSDPEVSQARGLGDARVVSGGLERRDACGGDVIFLHTALFASAGEMFPHVVFYKIASYELLWEDRLKACARTGKPVVWSTEMATLPEVERGFVVLRNADCTDLTLPHCNSVYPTKAEDCNLAAMRTMRDACQCPVGWSDHGEDAVVIYRAVHGWGATMVEFHELERQGPEFAAGLCWLPGQRKPVIAPLRTGFRAEGDAVAGPSRSEFEEHDWRAGPSDGLRPMAANRVTLAQGTSR